MINKIDNFMKLITAENVATAAHVPRRVVISVVTIATGYSAEKPSDVRLVRKVLVEDVGRSKDLCAVKILRVLEHEEEVYVTDRDAEQFSKSA
jgi:hypothetical protein